MEHIVYSSISRFLDTNKILCPRQHGFCAGHSCETQLILAIDDWAKTLDHGAQADVAIFDFSKAFDSVHIRDSWLSLNIMAYLAILSNG